MQTRENRIQNMQDGDTLDVAVIGGGTTGASVYNKLCRLGYRTALIDKADFAAGTSQSSGMMIWGGLLYLKSLDIQTVIKLCHARDDLIMQIPDHVSPCNMRFIPSKYGQNQPWFVMLGLWLYWLFGARSRRFPRMSHSYPERELIQSERFLGSCNYEEAFLNHSDSQFVLKWISEFDGENSIPLNYCGVMGGRFSTGDSLWHLDLKDCISGKEASVKAKRVVNCCGVWTDELNYMLHIRSRFSHVFSKGVYLLFRRKPCHKDTIVVELGHHNAVQTYVPWGPVAMWGPSETEVNNLDCAFETNTEDIRYLLQTANSNLSKPVNPEDIISVRCGVRPLGVPREYSENRYPLELSRRYFVEEDKEIRAISVYGGKLTASNLLADKVARMIAKSLPSTQKAAVSIAPIIPQREICAILGIPQVTPDWSRKHEFCETLEDYLRRRTNISQWTERMGMGNCNKHEDAISRIAATFAATPSQAAKIVDEYSESVCRPFDTLLRSV